MPTTYYFDENMSEYSALSLHQIRSYLTGEGISTIITEFEQRGTSDEDIAAHLNVKGHKCVIVTQDDDFTKRELYSKIMSSKNMGLFLIKFPRGSKSWDQHLFLTNHWEGIVSHSRKYPFAYLVRNKNKFDRI